MKLAHIYYFLANNVGSALLLSLTIFPKQLFVEVIIIPKITEYIIKLYFIGKGGSKMQLSHFCFY